MRKLSLMLTLGGLLSLTSAHAQLVHRYDFSAADQGNDTVGTANGTLAGNATIANGMLTTTGAVGGFLTLPTSVGTGITGSFTIETYITRTETGGNFSSLFSFATDQNDFVLLNPDRAGSGTSANFKQAGINGGNEFNVQNNVAFVQGTAQQVAITYNAGTGTVSLYLNGTLQNSGALGTGFNFQTISNGTFDGIGGNSPFTGDPSFNGTTDDFRIYSQALTAAQITTLDNAGPNATNATINADIGAGGVPEPSTWMVMLTGLGTLAGLQRFRRSAA